MTIQPIELPALETQVSFLECLQINHDTVLAMEGIGDFFKTQASKVSDALSEEGLAQNVVNMASKLNKASLNWEHELYDAANTVMAKLYKGNEVRVRQLNGDLKKFDQDRKKYGRMMKDKGLPESQREESGQLYEEACSSYEDTASRIRALKNNIYLPTNVYTLVMERMNACKASLGDMKAMGEDHKFQIETWEKDTSFHRQPKPHDVYEDWLKKHAEMLNAKMEFRYHINEVMAQANELATKMGGYTYEPNPLTDMAVGRDFLAGIISVWADYKKRIKWVHERLSDIINEANKIVKGRDSIYSASDLNKEVSFIISYHMVYSQLIQAYLRPPLSIINSY